jgi:ABC-type bacteriocin/lantibiotic exporter with double-glycine peptidase domain
MSFALLFIPQQQRLLTMAPEHANVLLALNNSALYLGIAGGAALGGLALLALAVTQLAWVGVMSMLIALLIVAITLHRSREQTQAGEQREREREKMRVMKDAGEQAEKRGLLGMGSTFRLRRDRRQRDFCKQPLSDALFTAYGTDFG